MQKEFIPHQKSIKAKGSKKETSVKEKNVFGGGFITTDSAETQALGKILALDIRGGVICLSGELGAGKTTFTQGLLEGLGLRGPFTSPTFLILKEYEKVESRKSKVKKVYHIDAYRVGAEDILNLGWEEIIANENNIVIIEWAERVLDIIPAGSLWIDFKWTGENERRIVFKNSPNF